MVRFKTAAAVAGLFVVVGAVVSGSGATETLGKLGAVNALAGSFVVAFSAGLTVFWMTRWKLPVSTSQAIVGAIIGWNIFSGSATDAGTLTTIVSTWVICPVLAGALRRCCSWLCAPWSIAGRSDAATRFVHPSRAHPGGGFRLLQPGRQQHRQRHGRFRAFGALPRLTVFGGITLSGAQILFFFGGLAIALGIFTYSHKVMDTVGASLMKISPMAALVVVLAQAIVLFLFASARLESWLSAHGLPAFPLVPVSSSQAVSAP